MELFADMLLVGSTLFAALYCVILGRKVKKLMSVEDGMGAAIVSLAGQVSRFTQVIDRARSDAQLSEARLAELTVRAENAARQLELLMASLHDLPCDDKHSHSNVANLERVQFLRGSGRA